MLLALFGYCGYFDNFFVFVFLRIFVFGNLTVFIFSDMSEKQEEYSSRMKYKLGLEEWVQNFGRLKPK